MEQGLSQSPSSKQSHSSGCSSCAVEDEVAQLGDLARVRTKMYKKELRLIPQVTLNKSKRKNSETFFDASDDQVIKEKTEPDPSVSATVAHFLADKKLHDTRMKDEGHFATELEDCEQNIDRTSEGSYHFSLGTTQFADFDSETDYRPALKHLDDTIYIAKKVPKPKPFKYKPVQHFDAYAFMREFKVFATKLSYSIDPIKLNHVQQTQFESQNMFLSVQLKKSSEKVEKDFNELFKGEYVDLSAGAREGNRYSLIFWEAGTRIMKRELWSEDIEHFVYGGFSSRFWVLQQYINRMPRGADLPDWMLCWNMITLHLKKEGKTVDLVVSNQFQMDMLLQYLVQMLRINTVSHKRALLKAKMDHEEWSDQAMARKLAEFDSRQRKKQLDFAQAAKIYRFMRIRMKVSYAAWRRGVSVLHLLLKQIQDSYGYFHAHSPVQPVNLSLILTQAKMDDALHLMYSRQQHAELIGRLVGGHAELNSRQAEALENYESKMRLVRTVCRLAFFLLLHQLGVKLAHPLHALQLLLKREEVIKEHFIHRLKETAKYCRVPKGISQEELPLSYLFYNFSIKFIDRIKPEATQTHTCETQGSRAHLTEEAEVEKLLKVPQYSSKALSYVKIDRKRQQVVPVLNQEVQRETIAELQAKFGFLIKLLSLKRRKQFIESDFHHTLPDPDLTRPMANRDVHRLSEQLYARGNYLLKELVRREKHAEVAQIVQVLSTLRKYERQMLYLDARYKREMNLGEDRHSKMLKMFKTAKKSPRAQTPVVKSLKVIPE